MIPLFLGPFVLPKCSLGAMFVANVVVFSFYLLSGPI